MEGGLFSIGMGRTANPDSIAQIARKAGERIGQIKGIFASPPRPHAAAARSKAQRGNARPRHVEREERRKRVKSTFQFLHAANLRLS